jgi:hypothetical protein
VDGEDAAEFEGAAEERISEESRFAEEVESALRRGSEEENVEEHVGVVRREDHRPRGGNAARVLDQEAAMEETGEEPRQGTKDPVEKSVGHRRCLSV